MLVLVSAAACGPRVVRVPVTPEQIREAEELVRQGDISFARRDFYPALIKYTEASKINPNSEITFNKMGISYSALAYYREAESALKRALALNDEFIYVYNNLGTVYFAQGMLGKAEDYFRKAIRMDPDVASFHINLGQTHLEKGAFEKAMEEFRKGLAIDPSVLDKDQSLVVSTPRGTVSPEKSYNMARLYATLQDVDNAIKYLQEAIDQGFTHLAWVDSESDFDTIRDDERFALFLSEARLKYRSVPD